jgi:hypothetical protein
MTYYDSTTHVSAAQDNILKQDVEMYLTSARLTAGAHQADITN